MVETQKKVKQLKEGGGNLEGNGRSRTRREVVNETATLLLEQTLAECLSLLKAKCKIDGVVGKTLHSISTFEPLRNLHSEVRKLLETCSI